MRSRQGRSVREIVAWADEAMPGVGDPLVMRASAQLAAGHPEAAQATIDPVVRDEVPCAVPSSRVDAWLVLATADLQLGRTTTARRNVVQALDHAVACTVVRPFRYADPRLLTLLIQHIGTFGRELEPLVDTIVRRVTPGTTTTPDPELTDRERTVLTLLQSHRSIDEIAHDLTVSANTVKTHVRSVYSKLGVNSRRDAVVAARERCLV
jgi:LuxR family maltose regulon positive regulatory protein